MKNLKFLILGLSVIVATACKDNKKDNETVQETEVEVIETPEKTATKISVTLAPKSDSDVSGTIHFTQNDDKVTMEGTVTGLEEGKHAIHIHEKADCSAADGTSSGGHWNPTGQPHGAWGDETGYHKGDIGNLEANANGRATITKTTDEWCIGCGDQTKDILGKAVIVHVGVDDFKSQPSGDAGSRIGCAGIIE